MGDKVNALLSLVQKIYVTLEHYSPVFQHHPVVILSSVNVLILLSSLVLNHLTGASLHVKCLFFF